jgi:hypothetical protein
MGDYIGRISLATSAGEQINEILVLQPNTTAWMYWTRRGRHPVIKEIEENFKNFVYQLERKHVEYDLGSENVLKVLGNVEKGNLVLGERAYSLVVIPATMENIDSGTLELLGQFLNSGGKVLSFRKDIPLVDGSESNSCTELQNKYPKQWKLAEKPDENICNEWLSTVGFSVNETNNSGEMYYQRRMMQDGQMLFVVNSDEHEMVQATVTARGKSLVKMDLETGQIYLQPAARKDGNMEFEIQLGPVGSALYFIAENELDEPLLNMPETNWTKMEAEGGLEVKAETDNVLVLNYLDLKTPKSTLKDTYFMTALVSLFQENGVEFGNPWQHKIQYKKNYLELDNFDKNTGFKSDYHFYIAKEADITAFSEVKAVVERPEIWSVSINGNIVEKVGGAFWIDKDFPVFNIGKYLKKGRNTISLHANRMSIFAELMPVYIVGDFKVQPQKVGFEITNGKLKELGSWKDAGYMFYSNKVSYSQKINFKKSPNRVKVKLNKWNGTVAEVLVNNKEAGIIGWPPEELDVTEFLTDGQNEITVRVAGSLKNTFGEFYRQRKSWIYGPHGWNDAPMHQPSFDKYFLNDYGLFEPFEMLQSNE